MSSTSGFLPEIEQVAKEFSSVGLNSTAGQIRSMNSGLATFTKQAQWQDAWKKIEQEFANEWSSGSAHRADIYTHIFSVLAPVARDPNTVTTINSLIPLFESRRRAEDTIREIAGLSKGASTNYQGYLLVCFSYVMSMEGVFDETARFILILANLGRGTVVNYSAAQNDSWSTLKNKLQPFGNDFVRVIFDGHENHLRNSIAHARFTYDLKKNTITFEDFDPKTQTVSWGPTELAYKQVLDDYYQKIEDLASFVGLFLGMLHLRGLCWPVYQKLST